MYIHAVLSGHKHGAIPLHCQSATQNYLTGMLIFPFHFYFSIFLHVHAHSFIFSHLSWCFLGLTWRPKSQILKMVLVEDKLVNPYKCWNKFLDPIWSLSYLGCHISKLKLRYLSCPCKCSAWPEMQYIQSANLQSQSNAGLLIPNKVDSVSPANEILSIFSSLFFILHKSFLPCAPTYSSPKGDSLHQVVSKAYFT